MPRNDDIIVDLTAAVESLVSELHLFCQAVDDLREELAWAIRNDRLRALPPVTSMPVDPCAADWAQRLNRLSADDLPATDDPQPPQQHHLFE